MTLRLALAALAAFGLACGRADRGAVAIPAAAPPAPSPTAAAAPPGDETSPNVAPTPPDCGGLVTIRLRGADGDGAGDRAIEVGAITVSADGAALEVRDATTGMLDVTRDHAYRLGVVAVPEGSTAVEVHVPVLGGRVGDDAADGCTGPIVFRFDPSKVAPTRCHVVVQLDPWSFSALATASKPQPVLVPAFTVRY